MRSAIPDPDIVDRYTETKTSTTRRTIVVRRETNASVEFWHGGRLVDQNSAWTHTETAIHEAHIAAKKFGIDQESTLRLRVRERIVTRKYLEDSLGCRGDTVDQEKTFSDAHVFCIHEEIPELRRHTLNWKMVIPIVFQKAEHDPGSELTEYFQAYDIAIRSEDLLYEGFAFGEVNQTDASRRPLAANEIPEEFAGRSTPYSAAVVLTGSWSVSAPINLDIKEVRRRLKAEMPDLRVKIDFDRENRRAVRHSWAIWSGEPAASLSLS